MSSKMRDQHNGTKSKVGLTIDHASGYGTRIYHIMHVLIITFVAAPLLPELLLLAAPSRTPT